MLQTTPSLKTTSFRRKNAHIKHNIRIAITAYITMFNHTAFSKNTKILKHIIIESATIDNISKTKLNFSLDFFIII